MWRLSSLLISPLRFSISSFRDLYDCSYTPLTPSGEFHISEFQISVRSVVDSFPSANHPKIGGTTVLKAETTMDFSLLFRTLAAWTLSCCDYAVNTVTFVTNWSWLTMSIKHWNCSTDLCFPQSTHTPCATGTTSFLKTQPYHQSDPQLHSVDLTNFSRMMIYQLSLQLLLYLLYHR